jgi:hypothetical protein
MVLVLEGLERKGGRRGAGMGGELGYRGRVAILSAGTVGMGEKVEEGSIKPY